MTTENKIRVLAGTLVLVSSALALIVSPYWLALAGFVGINLIQSAFTNFCPAESCLKKTLQGTDQCPNRVRLDISG